MSKKRDKLPKVLMYTDGSCLSNPGPGGYAAIIIEGDSLNHKKINGGSKHTTNQRMELQAVIEGLAAINERSEVIVCTDSACVCNSYTNKWYETWMKHGWRNSKNEPVANKDLWLKFLDLARYHDVKIVKVKAHSGELLNEECDRLAREAVSFSNIIQNISDMKFNN